MRAFAILFLLAIGTAVFAAPRVEPVSWDHDGTRFDGHLVYDDAVAAKRPGLLMVPNWMGINASALDKAREIAGQDYVLLLVDMYGHEVRPTSTEEAGAAARVLYADRAAMRGRIQAALDVLRGAVGRAPLDAGKLGGIGFCFGGSVVLELARSGAEVAGVVSFHGNLATTEPAQAGAVKASVLVLNGADDRGVPAEQIQAFQQEMTAAGADWQFVNYAGAVHCFAEADADRPPNCQYHERSAKRAYRAMADFFAERFAAP